MKIHVIFVEPANYTIDLCENVYENECLSFSFINSSSEASNNNGIISRAAYVFDKNDFLRNIKYLWNCSLSHDLIIVNGYNHPEFLLLWIFSFWNKSFIGIESDTPYCFLDGIKGLFKRIYLKIIFSNKLILGLAGGTDLHKDLFLNYGMPCKRIFFLPMMVNNQKFYNELKQTTARNSKLKFIYVGRLVSVKNLNLLIKAFTSVLQLGKNAHLDIIGDGICRNELQLFIKDIPEIQLLGKNFGSDLRLIYHNADVLILPSYQEPWGLVVNEALSAGLPVICSSAVGSAKDLILKPDAGWVFENNCEQELINILIDIIDNPEQIHHKAKRGQEYMLNYWNYNLYKQSLNMIFDYVKKN